MKEVITKSFKEVHQDLENESLFLTKDFNTKDFKKKADFLKDIGFTNSIATKIYAGIVENKGLISHYNDTYYGNSKFILEAQLERLCEKYDLYVRSAGHFMGDIPEKNVKDIMNFRVKLQDIDLKPHELDNLRDRFLFHDFNETITSYSLKHYEFTPFIQIAAIKSLFHPDAFAKTQDRIIGVKEIESKFEVDLDPIVLFKVKGGYLIITAWGDEANDELVFNQTLN